MSILDLNLDIFCLLVTCSSLRTYILGIFWTWTSTARRESVRCAARQVGGGALGCEQRHARQRLTRQPAAARAGTCWASSGPQGASGLAAHQGPGSERAAVQVSSPARRHVMPKKPHQHCNRERAGHVAQPKLLRPAVLLWLIN